MPMIIIINEIHLIISLLSLPIIKGNTKPNAIINNDIANKTNPIR